MGNRIRIETKHNSEKQMMTRNVPNNSFNRTPPRSSRLIPALAASLILGHESAYLMELR